MDGLVGSVATTDASLGSAGDATAKRLDAGRPAGVVVEVPIDALRPADSPRLDGLDEEHARNLAESEAELPAILVCRSSMRVIDGMHRVSAAKLNHHQTISARFFEGYEDEAFLLAVEANTTHGLPLTLADRRAAAQRIIDRNPEMSDRAIATVAGLGAKTVRAIRLESAGDSRDGDGRRIGRDGKVRPLSSAIGRRMASQVIADRPHASLREIARVAGISMGTARDVRERIRAGRDPVPLGQRRRDGATAKPRGSGTRLARPPAHQDDPRPIVAGLRRDPSLRYTDSGRALLRWLGMRLIVPAEWQGMIGDIPSHDTVLVSRIARACAAAWAGFADELERASRELR
jgi:hypothetical protein